MLFRPRSGTRYSAHCEDPPRLTSDRYDRQTEPVRTARRSRFFARARSGVGHVRRSGRITVETSGTRPLIRALCDAVRDCCSECGGGWVHRALTLFRHVQRIPRRTSPTQRPRSCRCLPRHGLGARHKSVSMSGAGTAGFGAVRCPSGAPMGQELLVECAARKLSTYPVEPEAHFLPQCSRITPAVVSDRAKGARGECKS